MSASGSVVRDHYAVLGVGRQAGRAEIRAAYRALVKKHHPDAGGDDQTILELNAAWAVLGDPHQRSHYDQLRTPQAIPTPRAGRGAARDGDLRAWLRQVYEPIDRLLAQVINPFSAQLRELAADPYDDALMEKFCAYLKQSQVRLNKVQALYRSLACPSSARGFGLSLYHCFSQVEDALAELERYTLGYVDGYLRDGREMLREAKHLRSVMKQERRLLDLT